MPAGMLAKMPAKVPAKKARNRKAPGFLISRKHIQKTIVFKYAACNSYSFLYINHQSKEFSLPRRSAAVFSSPAGGTIT